MSRESRLAYAALGFAIAAVVACWNPLAAPFGLVVGLVSIGLSVRALRRGGRRQFAAAGLALSVLAVGASALVLALTAGIGRDLSGQPVVAGPTREEAARTLDAAAERTRASRERARSELDQIDGKASGGRAREGAPQR